MCERMPTQKLIIRQYITSDIVIDKETTTFSLWNLLELAVNKAMFLKKIVLCSSGDIFATISWVYKKTLEMIYTCIRPVHRRMYIAEK